MPSTLVEVTWPETPDVIVQINGIILLLEKPRGFKKSFFGTVPKAQFDLTVDQAETLAAQLTKAVTDIRSLIADLPQEPTE